MTVEGWTRMHLDINLYQSTHTRFLSSTREMAHHCSVAFDHDHLAFKREPVLASSGIEMLGNSVASVFTWRVNKS